MRIKERFVTHCSPTFAGLKPSNLFTINTKEIKSQKNEFIAVYEQILSKGLKLKILARTGSRILILVYNPDMLFESLSLKKREYLAGVGYPITDSIEEYLSILGKRIYESQGNFPHEIGFFLGIPYEDVVGFINNKGKSFKLCGYWKVYGDCITCRKIFNAYKKQRESYIERLRQGADIGELIKIA
ncbi:DUF3793 family protein [Peptoniphilaceae bacterium SGI.131]